MADRAHSIMHRLRQATSELHDAAENHQFQSSLVQGDLPLAAYVAWLRQLHLVHRGLESHLAAKRQVDGRMATVVKDYQYGTNRIEADLVALDAAAGEEPTKATRSLLSRIDETAATCPIALLGMHYVLEGSKNGNKFIAKALRHKFPTTGSAGFTYLDPYGDDQRRLWSEFKSDMDAIELSEAEQEAIVDAACEMFRAVSAVSNDLAFTLPAQQTG